MIKVTIGIIILLLLSGCLESHYVPEPPAPHRVTQQIEVTPSIAQQAIPTPNITITPTPIISKLYNLTIATLDYNAISGNAILLISFPINGSASITCNDTKYYPESTFTMLDTKKKEITGYTFIVVCAPSIKGTIAIAGYSQMMVIPKVGASWKIKVKP